MLAQILNLNPPEDKDFWQEDKIKHYKWAYTHTNEIKSNQSKKTWGLNVFCGMVIGKEVIWDKLLHYWTNGNCDWGDVQADWAGCSDAWSNIPSKF